LSAPVRGEDGKKRWHGMPCHSIYKKGHLGAVSSTAFWFR
jgi:hypothetical protein